MSAEFQAFVPNPAASSFLDYLNADARIGTAANGKASMTVAEAGSQLVRGAPGWSSALGVPFTLSYAYRSTEPTRMPSDTAGFSRFTTAQILQTENALTAWSDAGNITFTRVGTGIAGEAAFSDSATMLFANYSSGEAGAAAFGQYPGSTNFASSAGDVWVNSTKSYNQTPTASNYGGLTLVHEIGHAIGLAHPGDYNVEEGKTLTYAADGAYYEDSTQYTVMSYFQEYETGADFGPAYPSVPMLDDIAAIQLEYGANMTTRTSDTTYGFNSNAGRPWFEATSSSTRLVFAVWDAGGSDTFDFSGYASRQLIDLRQGFFSNVGGLTGNVAIAMGVDIENARGGSGADTVNGNALANQLHGEGGDDSISGADGQDYLRGEDGNDSISGGTAFDDINGNLGDDTASGGDGDDWVVGGKDRDQLSGDAGADIVYGNIGDDTCDGGAGDDLVRGGQDNDSLSGGAGNDWLSGDKGNDTVTGGAGADIFHTFGDAGIDRVTDFNLAEGDRVQLDPGTSYTVAQAGADTVISMVGGGQMVLVGVSMASLTGTWIL